MKIKNRIKLLLISVLIGISSIFISSWYHQYKYNHSGISDCVSSYAFNNDYYLQIVANANEIEDQEAFAREVVEKCRKNSFQTIRFSTDENGYAHTVKMYVYLHKSDIEQTDPVLSMELTPLDFEHDYNIVDNIENYHLITNGNEIEL